MKAIVINLDSATDRLGFQSRQLAEFGLQWDRFPAITPATLTPADEDAHWQRWQRPLSSAEKAASASHRAVWDLVARGSVPVLVLEDDALLMPGTPALLTRLDDAADLDHVTLETRGRAKLVGRLHPDLPLARLWQDYSGAAAYVLWPSGAQKLIARADRSSGIADAIICAVYDMASWQADPALAIQIDQCTAHGIAPPIPVSTSIGRIDRSIYDGLTRPAYRAYRRRRIVAQLRMAVRRIAHLATASRRVVPLSGDPPG
jgi:glycosyl transferase, family 25